MTVQSNDSWRPVFSAESLAARAKLLSDIRAFFAACGVLEVETPILGPAGTPDPNIESFETRFGEHALYLHTSPEFAMKRLLAAGSGAIYQVCKVFRAEEHGRYHHPEFTMLEWYRPGFDHHQLMDDVAALLIAVGAPACIGRRRFEDAFEEAVGLNPHTASETSLHERIRAMSVNDGSSTPVLRGRAELLDYLFGFHVAPSLGRTGPEFIFDFPVEHAALARIRPDPVPVAERFELFWQGVELANGFHELTDAVEQRRRFEADNNRRRERGLATVALDRQLIQALTAGLPECAGVALGIDRLMLLLSGASSLAQGTLPFAADLFPR